MIRSLLTRQRQWNNQIYKSYQVPSVQAAEAAVAGVALLANLYPNTIVVPNASKIHIANHKEIMSDKVELRIIQDRCFPWLNEDVMPAMRLYAVAKLIIDQELSLLNSGFTFIDARPSNYWILSGSIKLVDLGSIVVLSSHAIQSFITDFIRNFLTPLAYEKYLKVPACTLFQNNEFLLNKVSLPLTLGASLDYLALVLKLRVKAKIAKAVIEGTPEFMEYITNISSMNQSMPDVSVVINKVNKLRLVLSQMLPRTSKKSSEWANYQSFHSHEYTTNKRAALREIIDTKLSHMNLVDLGSNVTGLNHSNIVMRIDADHQICNDLASMHPDSNVACLDLSSHLSHTRSSESVINLFGHTKCAIATGILHHLILGLGIKPAHLYKSFHNFFEVILLEYQTLEDPSVKLLLNKRNEPVDWRWDTGHLPHIEKYFTVVERHYVSKTRDIYYLASKA
jgi:hypothetical protein